MFLETRQGKQTFLPATLTLILLGLLLALTLHSGRTATAAPNACPTNDFPDDTDSTHVLSGDIFVGQDILIRNDMSVTIEAGSNIIFCDEFDIRVSSGGTLIAQGTALNPITFNSDNPAVQWGALEFFDANEASALSHALFENGGGDQADEDNTYLGTIEIDGNNESVTASPAIDNVTITNSGTNGLYFETQSDDPTPASVTNLTITNSALAAVLMNASSLGGLGTGNQYTDNTTNHIIVTGGRVAHPQTWTDQGIPIEVQTDIDIAPLSGDDPTAIVTIGAGTSFLMHPDVSWQFGSSFDRTGGLRAIGTAGNPITIDAFDANQNWGHLFFADTGRDVVMEYVELTDGGGEADIETATLEIRVLVEDTLSLPAFDNVTINNSSSNGIYIENASDDQTPAVVTNTTINNSTDAAIRMDVDSFPGIGSGNQFNGNGSDTIQLMGGGISRVAYSQTWSNPGMPVELEAGTVIIASDELEAPAEVTIEAGLTFLMHPEAILSVGTSLSRPGSLYANGTAAEPITFTRLDATSANWGRLWLQQYDTSEVELNNVILEYGGSRDGTLPEDNGMIYGSGPLTINDSIIRHSSSNGIYFTEGVALINNSTIEQNQVNGLYTVGDINGTTLRSNTIQNNTEHGISVNNGDNPNSPICVDAANNYWGNDSGPADSYAALDGCGIASTNGGSGDSVTAGVIYSPWIRLNATYVYLPFVTQE